MFFVHSVAIFVYLLIATIAVVVPLWRVFTRAGLNPALSLFVIVPWIGWLVVLILLAFLRWPATEPDAGD